MVLRVSVTRALAIALLAWLLPTLLMAPVARAEPDPPPPPELVAVAAISIDADTGEVLYEKNARSSLAIASTTKLMTAIVAVEHARLDEVVTIIGEDLIGEASMGLTVGEKVTIEDLIYGLLLNSGNDAAMAIARHVGGSIGEPAEASPVSRFAALMNAKAEEYGLTGTHFVNPHGLDAEAHYGSAYDLAVIAREFKRNPFLAKVAAAEEYDAAGHRLRNLNKLLSSYPGVDGLKTGLTDNAGLCLVASAQRGERKVITVVLNSSQWYDDTISLLDYSFAYLATIPTPAATPVKVDAAAMRSVRPQPEVGAGAPAEATAVASQEPVEDVGAAQSSAPVQWPEVAFAIVAAVASISVLHLGVTFGARRLWRGRRLAMAHSGASSSPASTYSTGRGYEPRPRGKLLQSGARTLSIPAEASAAGYDPNAMTEDLTPATGVLPVALLDGIFAQAESGDERGATRELIRIIRNERGVCNQLELESDDLPAGTVGCVVRALLVCGERERAKLLLLRAARQHPRDSKLQLMARLID